MKRYIVSSLLLASCLTLGAETTSGIPNQYFGTWGGSQMSCQVSRGEHTNLTIEKSKLSFYASRAKVLAVATHGERELALLAEFSSEGEVSLEALKFRLSSDNNTLTTVSGFQNGMVRVRCATTVK